MPLHDPLAGQPGYALRRASAAAMARFRDRLAPLDLRATEATVILTILENPGVTQSDIGRMLAIKRANMAPIIARLSTRGLIDKSRVDGRSQGLKLSQAGIVLAQEVRQTVDSHEATLVACLPEEVRTIFLSALRAIWKGCEDEN